MNAPAIPETIERALPQTATSWNADEWSFTAVLAAEGVAERRFDSRGEYLELISLDQPWPQQIPLLDTHRSDSIDRQLGSVTHIRVERGELVGTAILSRDNPRSQRIAADIERGHQFGFSVGGDAMKMIERIDPATGRRVKIAVEFKLNELSVCPRPKDDKTRIRSLINMTVETPPVNQPAPAPVVPPAVTPPPAPVATIERAAFNGEIRTLGQSLGLSADWINRQIDTANDITAERENALNEMIQRSRTVPVSHIHVVADHTDPTEIRRAMSDALAHRLAPAHVKLEGRGRDFANYRVINMVAELANARGDRVSPYDHNGLIERAVGAHSTSDFPLLLQDSIHKALMPQYQAAQPTYRQWMARRSFSDYRDHSFLRAGDFPPFREVNESGEIKSGTLSERREKVHAKALGSSITVGHHLLINDDLSVLQDFSSMIALRAASDENKLAYALLTSNPTLSDGTAVFHSSRGNLAASGTALDVATVASALIALRKMKSLDDLTLNLAPRFIVVGADNELAVRTLLTAITPAKKSDVNPFSGSMDPVIDANITDNRWYIFPDPAAVPNFVFGYVNGSEGPQVTTERDPKTRGVTTTAWLDWGCGALDDKAYLNPGS